MSRADKVFLSLFFIIIGIGIGAMLSEHKYAKIINEMQAEQNERVERS